MTLADQIKRWRADRMSFRRDVIYLENGKPFGDAIEPWQEEDFKALDSTQHRHGYLERPRGHSKTGDIGTEAVTELVLGLSGQNLYCAAADEDQARLLFEDVTGKFQRSPLLKNTAKITRNEIVIKATGSRLKVMASNAPTAYGLRPDWIAVDELAEWAKRDLWDSLWTATGKRPRCRMLVISTAGWDQTSIASEVRKIAESEPDWYFSSRGQCASWIRKEWLDQQRRTLPAHVFSRLHENRWVDGVGAFLTTAEVDAIFSGMPKSSSGSQAIGLDLGISKDKTVLSLVRRDRTGLLIVEVLETWAARSGNRVSLEDVEEATRTLSKKFHAPVILDPWQGVLMGQRLRSKGIQVIEFNFSGDNRKRLFGTLLDLIRTNKLRSHPHDDLRRELLGLEVEETASGWRVDHKPGRHDDHVISVALAIQHLASKTGQPDIKFIGGPPIHTGIRQREDGAFEAVYE